MGFTEPDSVPQPPGQMPAAAGAGPAPVPYQGPDLSPEPPDYAVALGPLADPGQHVMSGLAAGNSVVESADAHSIDARLADAPYYPGSVSPVYVGGDADAGGRDDVASTVGGAVAAQSARWHELQSDTFGAGSVIGDLMALPPNPLDPGVGSLGTTDPAGHFYDPPRDYSTNP